MDDFEDLVLELRTGAGRRGLGFVEALFPGEPTVVFSYDNSTVDEVLDLAQNMFAPFLAMTVSRLEASELTESWDTDDGVPVPPAELQAQWEARTGQIDGVSVHWIAGGAVYLYVAVPAWKQELEELRESWSEDQDTQRSDMVMAERIRITHLAEQLESEPDYRAGNAQTRGSVGKALLDPMLQSNEGSAMIYLVLREASRLVRDNAQFAYSKLIGQMDELAAELRSSRHWLGAHRASERTAAARNLLVERSGGYSPPGALVEDLRRLAEK